MKSAFLAFGVFMSMVFLVFISAKGAKADTRINRSYLPRGPQLDPKKRPFCNAFTGCGKKRSEIPPQPSPVDLSGGDDESISSLLDLSAEPAVEDLSRQIMSEAKLWEAIQEANQELLRRKQQSAEEGNNLAGVGAGGKCGLSTCFI